MLHEILISSPTLEFFLILDIFLKESLLLLLFILVGESRVSFLLKVESLNLVGESIVSSLVIDY